MKFTLHTADEAQAPANLYYPHKIVVQDENTLASAVRCDYVGAQFAGNRRSIANFVGADVVILDCDNENDDPQTWKLPADVEAAFPGVEFYVHYSRNHWRPKGQKAARPKFHVFFPIERIADAAKLTGMKKKALRVFPAFDENAADAARFIFGTQNALVEHHPGARSLTAFLQDIPDEAPQPQPASALPGGDWAVQGREVIPEGRSNATLHAYAVKVLKACGPTPQAGEAFLRNAAQCSPPLDRKELDDIWVSAARFYQTSIATAPDYLPPEVWEEKNAVSRQHAAPALSSRSSALCTARM